MNVENIIEEKINLLNSIKDYEIEIGVISETSKRKDKISIGLTNAEIMYIHENGSPLKNIPARPVLEMTLQYVQVNLIQKVIDKISDGIFNHNWKKSDIENELKKLCVRMENYARDIIYLNDGRLAPNSYSVAKKKKGNHPLFDTGQLARSIICRLINKN